MRLLLRLRFLLAVVSVLAATPPVTAQTIPLPVLPKAPPSPDPVAPEAPGAPAGAVPVATPPAPDWEYALSVGLGYDNNIDFIQPDGPSSSVFTPRAQIARVFRSPRGQIRFVGGGQWNGYPSESDLNRYYADLGVSAEYQSSANTSWHAAGSYWWGYSDVAPVLRLQGVPLPLVKTQSLLGELGVTHRLAARTSVKLDGRFFKTLFQETGLVDGASLRGTLALEQRFGARDTGALVYSPEQILENESERKYVSHFGSLQWTHLFDPRNGLLLEAGASYTPDAAAVGLVRRGSFFGGASFTRQIARSAITVILRREVTPAFGLGVSFLATRGGLRVLVPMGQHWHFRTAAYYTRPDSVEDAAFAYPAEADATVAVGRRLGRHLEISGQTTYRRRGETEGIRTINAFQAGVVLTWTPPGKATTQGGGFGY